MAQPPQQIDAKYVKERLIKYLDEKGPSLPVNLAKHVGLNSLFTSAFLSELSGEGLLKISDMKVGGSPLYFTSDKFAMLENFVKHLDAKDREAFLLLKEKSVLEDTQLTPITRVALRSLKDFAIPLKKDSQLFWRYFLINEEQALEKLFPAKKPEIEVKKEEIKYKGPETQSSEAPKEAKIKEKLVKELKQESKPELNVNEQESELKKINLELEEKKKELEKLKKEILRTSKLKKPAKKPDEKPEKKKKENLKEEKFLNEIKETLIKKGIDLINIEQYNKKQVFARITVQDKEYLLAAYDKKKVEASDLMNAYKKSLTLKLPYYIISKGDTSKKTKEIIEAYKNLAAIESLEEKKEENPEVK